MNLVLTRPETVTAVRTRLPSALQTTWARIDTLHERIRNALTDDDFSALTELTSEHKQNVIALAEALDASNADAESQVVVLRQLRTRNDELQELAERSLAAAMHASSHAHQRHASVNAYQSQQQLP
ncbi:MAG TPA: hypothetical protein PKC08_10075 [Pseudomonadales bacterium]|nr:hypothetical protein [Pseudomonadales bacterium]